jgi:uracil-DNA glycosylase
MMFPFNKSLTLAERTAALKIIKDEVLALTNSPLYAFRTESKNLPVIGEGSHEARVMFVGEAPGRNEAATGRPFCGAAGKLLDVVNLHRLGIDVWFKGVESVGKSWERVCHGKRG